MRRSSLVLVGLFTAALAAGCDNGPDTSPTPPPAPTITETFTGTVTLNGAVTHSFTATAAGEVRATITAVTPTGATLGFQLGTFIFSTCTAVLSNDVAPVNSILSGSTQSSASLCVKLHDPNGVLTESSVDYTVTVEHR